jgi:heterodisulfide reductase subunit B
VRWPFKTVCCGGSQLLAVPEVAAEAGLAILDMARQAGADCIVTACPMCHANLETQQWRRLRAGRDGRGRGTAPLPVLYLTELVGLALELKPARGWLRRHLCDARPLLGRLEAR